MTKHRIVLGDSRGNELMKLEVQVVIEELGVRDIPFLKALADLMGMDFFYTEED